MIGLALVSMLAGFLWSNREGFKFKKDAPRYERVTRGDLVQRVTITGLVHPARRTAFVAPYAGYVQKIFVNVGNKVSAGDPIISVTTSLQSQETVFPIRAPFPGRVVAVRKIEGEFVAERDVKDPIVRVDDESRYYVIAKAPELDASRIRRNMDVEIRINALNQLEPLAGRVIDLDLAAEEADGWRSQQSTFKVRAEIKSPPQDLRAGQSAIIDVVTKRVPDVLILPHEFINREGTQHFVIDRIGRRRNIEIGEQSDMGVEVKSGINENDEVAQVDFAKLLESTTP